MPWTDRIPAATRRRLRVIGWRTRRPVAALCAGLAVLLVVEHLRPPDPPTVEVAVAARDLPADHALTEHDVVLRTVPADLVPAGLVPAGLAPAGLAPTDPVPADPVPAAPVPADLAPIDPHLTGVEPSDPARTSVGADAGVGAGVGARADPVVGLLGRRLAVAVPAGLPLVPELMVDDAAAPPPGTVVVPVRFADAGVAAVLRAGMQIDVVASGLHDGAAPERLARAALVLGGPDGVARDDAADPGAGGGLFGGDPGAGSGGTGAGSGAGGAGSGGRSAGGGASGGAGTGGGGRVGGGDVPVLLAVTPEESVTLGGASGSRALGAVIVG